MVSIIRRACWITCSRAIWVQPASLPTTAMTGSLYRAQLANAAGTSFSGTASELGEGAGFFALAALA